MLLVEARLSKRFYPDTFSLQACEATNTISNVTRVTRDVGNSVVLTVQQAVSLVTNAVNNVVNTVSRTAASIQNTVSTTVSNAVKTVSNTVSSSQTVTINGIPFFQQVGTDAGAGQIYEWSAYSASHNSGCISLNFILHSANLGVYPTPAPPLFDKVAESAIFSEIMATFNWLP